MTDRPLILLAATSGALCGVLAALSLPEGALIVLLVACHFAALRLYQLEHRTPASGPESD